ncbi:hypothetical protein [Archangium lansingense]|uniref:Uncharacterized protein n=1 Tax=Archangium lansingense TaxID=2995310 RepID=A0ABT4A9H6_9BACT|nr:hypothetical protein [Archangium lansinium]MCY1077914.1 hypothetical protein [Archangium lansinium]
MGAAGATASEVIEQALGALPASVREELRARLAGADALVVMHIRDERFRWMSLFTFPFKVLLWSLVLLVLLWVFLQNLTSGEGDPGDGDTPQRSSPKPEALPRYEGSKDSSVPVYVSRVERPARSWIPGFLRFRFTVPVHTVEVVTSPSEAPPFRFTVSGERQGHAAVAALYAVASVARLKLVELNQGPPPVVVHRGHGRLPLMLDPRSLDLKWARSEVAAAGFELVTTSAGLELRHAHSPTSKGLAWVFLVGMLLVSPAFLWLASFRRLLLNFLFDAWGRPPGADVFFVDGEAVGYCYKRAGRTWSRVAVPRSQLQAIVFGEELGFDDQVSYGQPRLRLVGNGSVYTVDYSLGDRLGNAIRDLLVSEVLASESTRPGATASTGS